MTLAEAETQLIDICKRAGVSGPDVILDNRDGRFTAVWFEQKLALIIEGDDPDLDADVVAFPDLHGDREDEGGMDAAA